MWCFQCGAEYEAGVETCAECGVGLVAAAPLAPEEVGSSEEEQLAYDLHVLDRLAIHIRDHVALTNSGARRATA